MAGPRAHLGDDRLVDTAHPGLRPAAGDDLQGALPRNGALAPGRGRRNAYRAHLCAHFGRSLTLCKESHRRRLSGTRACHGPIGRQRPSKRRISKEGDEMLRRLLVGSAHYILGPFGSDSDLRRHGEKIASRGGKNAKKRAVVAVARKLAVLLHSLWVTRERSTSHCATPSAPEAKRLRRRRGSTSNEEAQKLKRRWRSRHSAPRARRTPCARSLRI